MITGKNITWKFKKSGNLVLNQVSFELKKGKITAFIGKSGAGKTTLLKCIANLYRGYEGCITYNEEDLKNLTSLKRAATIGFVLQQFHLFPHLTVLQNCTYALKKPLLAIETLTLLGMLPFINAFPSQLSGGEQQRVAIARALVLEPKILLLDEPTSALDPDSKQKLASILLELNKKGLTLALSSHDMPFIEKIKDRIYYLEEGKIVEEYDHMEHKLESKEKIKHFLMRENEKSNFSI